MEAATLEVTRAKELISTRAWTYSVLGQIDATAWSADCETGANPKCELSETAFTTTASTWGWPASNKCDYSVTVGPLTTTYGCQMLGLKGASAGLHQSAVAAMGTVRDGATAPTELYLAIETADYSYAASGTTRLADALTAYETW